MAEKNLYLTHFGQLEKALGDRDRPWLRRIRKAALARFDALGFPTARNEDWKFTNLAPLAKMPLRLATSPGWVAKGVIESLAARIGPGPRLVCVNGRFVPELSALAPLPAGAVVTSLAMALARHADLVEPHLARYARYEDNALTALNTAFIQDGVFVYLPNKVVLEHPLHLVFVSTTAGEQPVSYVRNLIVAGPHCQATVLEQYAGPEDDVYFTSAVTEIVAGENSVLDHYKIQEESKKAFHIAATQVVQARNSKVSSHAVMLGGGLARNETRVLLDAEGCAANLNGLYLADGRQHVDNFTVIDHAKPHGTSHELYKGILTDHAHGVFNGKIVVRPDAQKTDAKQTNQVLLLSEDAVINTKPQLEIFADDVKCTHGATVGQLDDDAIFYLRARGIGHKEARALLTFAFANDVISRIEIAVIRDHLEKLLLDRKIIL